MASPTSSCAGFVRVLQDQQYAAIEHCDALKHPLAKPAAKVHKLCTVVENGRVVVRPIESSRSESE
ncbi:hypothetical protein H6F51_14835 [Cyanobacteria bacterium FACHB-DQ100]|nr:hypothetical protein [Cyanobacteria bacterium FACHB-DQ100]